MTTPPTPVPSANFHHEHGRYPELALLDEFEARCRELKPILVERLLQYASRDPKTMDAAKQVAIKQKWNHSDRKAAGELFLIAQRRGKEFADYIARTRNALSMCICSLQLIYERRTRDPEAEPIDSTFLDELEYEIDHLPPPIEPIPRQLPNELTPLASIGMRVEPFGSLIEGTANFGTLILMFGSSGIGKTAALIDAALHVSAGRPWRGRKTTSGAVLYLAAEDAAGVRDKARAWCVLHGITNAPFAVLDRALDFTTEAGAAELMDVIYAWQIETLRPVVLVVIDTLAASFGGRDENLGQDMKAFVANAARIQREIGAAVAVAHHSGKAAAAGPRGHGSLAAAADVIFRVERGQFVVEKQRHSVAGGVFPFRLEPVQIGSDATGRPIMSAVAVPQEETNIRAAKAPGKTDLAKVLGQAVAAAGDKGTPLRLNKTGGLYERRNELPAPLSGMSRDGLRTLARQAMDAGYVVNNGGILRVEVQ